MGTFDTISVHLKLLKKIKYIDLKKKKNYKHGIDLSLNLNKEPSPDRATAGDWASIQPKSADSLSWKGNSRNFWNS